MVRDETLRNTIHKNKIKRQFFSNLPKVKWVGIAILVGIVLFIGYSFILPAIRLAKDVFSGPIDIGSFVTSKKTALKEDNGRTNVLLLGTGDANHEGLNLTDTMILTSLDQKTYDLAMISIPRDIWINKLSDKINSAYALSEEKQKGSGLTAVKSVVYETLGVPIQYAVKVNFTAFKKAIDLVGGISVNVDNTFDDYLYPIEGKENDPCDNDPEFKCRYEHLHFDKGVTTMDGSLALKYVRSRYAEGEEGTDFARSKRQQKVILSLKNKILTPQILLDPNKIRDLLKVFGDNVETDVAANEINDVAKVGLSINKNLKTEKIRSFVLDTGDDKTGRVGLLVNPPTWQYGAWVLIPVNNDWKDIQNKVREFLYGEDPLLSQTPTQ